MITADLAELAEYVRAKKDTGARIVWTNGCFDLMHPGHIETFRQSKNFGDVLVVGVNSDRSPYWATKPGRPINDERFRAAMVEAIRYVDAVYLFDGENPAEAIGAILPDVLVKGGDYRKEDIAGYDAVERHGGSVELVPIVSGYSTSSVVRKIISVYGDHPDSDR